MKLLITMVGTCLGLLGPAVAVAAGPSTISVLNGATTVESYGGVQVWSDYSPASHSWQLIVRRNGQISAVSIPAAAKAIEADVGPGPSGAPMLAYLGCTSTCHVVVSGVDASDPQTVPGSEGASHPTIWGDRVAWLNGKTRVITSRLNGSGRKVLLGAPRRKCYYTHGFSATPESPLVCTAPEEPSVDALQLYRSRLALIDSFRVPDEYEGHWEVRTESISGGPQHLVAILGDGIGSESYVDPSWSNGKLYFYEDSNGAGFKVYRYNPAHNTYAMAEAHGYLSGFSVIGDRAYEATASENPGAIPECAKQEGEPCVLRLSEPFALKPTKAPVFVP